MLERRHEPRAISMFKSAYVRTAEGLYFATLRNVSETGVCLDAYPGVAVGDRIEYCIDTGGPCKGMVRWVQDGRIGVSADALGISPAARNACFPPRSVRVPLLFSARLFMEGRQEDVTIHNLSLRGACISSPLGLIQGQLVSIRIADRVFELATIRWVNDGQAGVRFAKPVHPAEFRELVARLQQPPEDRGSDVSLHSLPDVIDTAA